MPNDDPRLARDVSDLGGRMRASTNTHIKKSDLNGLAFSERGFRASALCSAVKAHPMLVLFCTLFFGCAGLVTAIVLEDRYSATALILLERSQVPESAAKVAAVPEGEVEVIKSDGIAAKVAAILRLEEDPRFGSPDLSERMRELFGRMKPWLDINTKPMPSILVRPAVEAAPLHSEVLTRALKWLNKVVTIRRRGMTDVIAIEATTANGEDAATIANIYADVYLQDQVNAKLAKLEHEEDVLSKFAKKYNADLASPAADVAVRDLYKDILTRLNALAQKKATLSADARVVSPALVSTIPIFPPRPGIVLLALLAGFVTGCVCAYLRANPTPRACYFCSKRI